MTHVPILPKAAAVIAAALVCSLACCRPALAAFPGRDGVIAFTKTDRYRNQTLWTVDPRTRRQRQVTSVPAACRRLSQSWLDDAPAFSPSGRFLYYSHSGGCGGLADGLYRVAVGGGAPRVVLLDGRRFATWWPVPTAQGRLLFINDVPISKRRDPDEFSDTIYSVRARGGRPRKLSPRRATSDEFPAVSAGGRVLFSRDNHRLVIGRRGRRLPRGGVRVLASFPHGTFASSDWSPHAQSVVFEHQPGGRGGFHSDIYSIGLHGGRPRRLTHIGDAVSPVWSPSGRSIAFSVTPNAHPTKGALYVMDRRGRHRRRILPLIDEVRLSWQPLPRR